MMNEKKKKDDEEKNGYMIDCKGDNRITSWCVYMCVWFFVYT